MKPDVKVFTKDNPCTKVDIWNCFRGPMGFTLIQVDRAHSIIGKNAPRVMLKNGYIERRAGKMGQDLYLMTSKGREWLIQGIASHLRRHPGDAAKMTVRFMETGRTAKRLKRKEVT